MMVANLKGSAGFLDSRQAAAYLRLSVEHVKRLAASGAIPAYKPRRSWLFDPAELNQWVRGEWSKKGSDE